MTILGVPSTSRLLSLTLCLFFGIPALAGEYNWVVRKTQWSDNDEKNYGKLVTSIGTAVETKKCGTVDRCMRSAANPYRATDPRGLYFRSDCADFPYFMRAYFAWKNELPFSIASDMDPVPGSKAPDIRYSPLGNVVSARKSFVQQGWDEVIITSVLNTIIPTYVSSAMFRVGPLAPDRGSRFVDFYPVRIDRRSVAPGTIMYDANGHVAIVYKVTDDGQVWYVDAHPDNSLTVGRFNIKVARSNPGAGAGFKKWRPQRLVNADQSWSGEYTDGTIEALANARIPDYSYEQYYGTNGTPKTDWRAAEFIHNGKKVTFHEYVRLRLAVGGLKINPITEFKSNIAEMCRSLTDRVDSVKVAVAAGIPQKPHPDRLPANIYGADGDWETYSTPGRDVSLRIFFRHLMAIAQDSVTRWKAQDPAIEYTGTNLAADLLQTYQVDAAACMFNYTNSNGVNVFLTLESARQRAYLMSFDPYHCVERRWGAVGAELASCRETPDKALWYQRTQQLRNHTERKVDVRTDLTLDQWAKTVPGVGVEVPESLDIETLLRGLQ